MTYPNIEPDQTEAQMVSLYDYFIRLTGLPELSIDELLLESKTPEQRDWIERFTEAWDIMLEREYAKQKTGCNDGTL